MICPNCNTTNLENATNCFKCGAVLSPGGGNLVNPPNPAPVPPIMANNGFQGMPNREPPKKKKANWKIPVLILVVILLIALIAIGAPYFLQKKHDYGETKSHQDTSYAYSENGIPKFITGNVVTQTVNSREDAYKALEELKDILSFQNVNEFNYLSEEKVNGITYYHFQQVYNQIPVYNHTLILSADQNGKVLSFSGYYVPDLEIDVEGPISEEKVEEITKDYTKVETEISKKELAIYGDKLVYIATYCTDNEIGDLFIDAKTGNVLEKADLLHYSTNYPYTGYGTDFQEYTINLEKYFDTTSLKQRYRFHDIERNIYISNYNRVGKLLALFVSAIPGKYALEIDIDEEDPFPLQNGSIRDCISAMANFAKIYDYYKNVLGRNSYDNKGSSIVVNVGVTEKTFTTKSFNNAFWARYWNQMFIGDFNGTSMAQSLDVLAHEFTHGVVQHTANLNSANDDKVRGAETGALDEAYADIMGALIEDKDWTVPDGFDVIVRDNANPLKYRNPEKKDGEYYEEGGEAHTLMTVVTHAAYLMDEAGAFESHEQMAKVWYQSLYLLSSDANFEDCAYAVMESARSLGLSSESLMKIQNAFIETNMLENKNYKVNLEVKSGSEALNGVSLEVLKDGQTIESLTINEKSSFELPGGEYHLVLSKKDFENYEMDIFVTSDKEIQIEMATVKKENPSKPGTGGQSTSGGSGGAYTKNLCTTNDCVKVVMYFPDYAGDGSSAESKYTYSYNRGSVLSSSAVTDTINQSLGTNLLTSDGNSFYFNINGIKMEITWYYRGTTTKFDWNQPINEDIEIEFNFLAGMTNMFPIN